MAANKSNLQTVSLKTFKSWDFHQDFTIQDDREKITILQCNICSHHIADICREAKSRGISGQVQFCVSDNVLPWVMQQQNLLLLKGVPVKSFLMIMLICL